LLYNKIFFIAFLCITLVNQEHSKQVLRLQIEKVKSKTSQKFAALVKKNLYGKKCNRCIVKLEKKSK